MENPSINSNKIKIDTYDLLLRFEQRPRHDKTWHPEQ